MAAERGERALCPVPDVLVQVRYDCVCAWERSEKLADDGADGMFSRLYKYAHQQHIKCQLRHRITKRISAPPGELQLSRLFALKPAVQMVLRGEQRDLHL